MARLVKCGFERCPLHRTFGSYDLLHRCLEERCVAALSQDSENLEAGKEKKVVEGTPILWQELVHQEVGKKLVEGIIALPHDSENLEAGKEKNMVEGTLASARLREPGSWKGEETGGT